MKSKMKRYIFGFICVVCFILLDQFTKYLAVIKLKGKNPFVLIEDILELNYLENQGAAFGIFEGKKIFLIGFTSIIILSLIYIYFKIPMEKKFLYLRIVTLFLISGAIGNLLDRILLNYVVDFIYFKLINFPIFNVADIYVSCSAVLLGYLIIFYYKEKDLEQIFSKENIIG